MKDILEPFPLVTLRWGSTVGLGVDWALRTRMRVHCVVRLMAQSAYFFRVMKGKENGLQGWQDY